MPPVDPSPPHPPAAPAAQQPLAPAMRPRRVTLCVNGTEHVLELEPWVSLLDLLRERLDLTGTKKGCDHGQCGACTVLVDGQRVLSCLSLAVMRDGCEVTTVEGLAGLAAAQPAGAQRGTPPQVLDAPRSDGLPTAIPLHPIQAAFVRHDALQCGYCTPGQLCSAVGLMNEGEARTVDEVRELMSGNICRCGAYPQITAAVCEVALGDGAARSRTAHEPVVTGTVPA